MNKILQINNKKNIIQKNISKNISKKYDFSNLNMYKEKINEEYEILQKYDYIKEEKKINILMRTSNRPQYFDDCIKSVLNQKYINYHIFICYDKKESLSYLEKYKNNDKITYFSISIDSKEKYKFNLYNNILIEKVTGDEWIMFLDDDDMFTHEYVLKIINENIINDKDLLIWKFMRPDRLIFPPDVNNVELETIGTPCFCFNKKYLYSSKWNDKQGGDFYFFNQLIKNYKFNRKFLNYILGRTISEDRIGNYGN